MLYFEMEVEYHKYFYFLSILEFQSLPRKFLDHHHITIYVTISIASQSSKGKQMGKMVFLIKDAIKLYK
jgi:hypothetical protein